MRGRSNGDGRSRGNRDSALLQGAVDGIESRVRDCAGMLHAELAIGRKGHRALSVSGLGEKQPHRLEKVLLIGRPMSMAFHADELLRLMCCREEAFTLPERDDAVGSAVSNYHGALGET